MFKIFKMKPKTTAEVKIEQIVKMMFPPLELHTDKEGNKFHIDHSIDTNLEAALMDLQEGHNDAASQQTIRSVVDQIIRVRKLLEAYQEIDAEAKYFIAEDPEGKNVEEIQAADNGY
jgi:hypothetical protein